MRLPGRALVAVLLAGAALGATAQPAAAHGVGGVRPANYETRILAVSPSTPGLSIRPVDLGARLELRNDTGHRVVVLGYDGEPYLRSDGRGVYENRRSPAVGLNRTRYGDRQPTAAFDAAAPPEWRRISGGATVRWHDHRAHWMSRSDPPVVQRDPGSVHLIQRFDIPLQVDGEAVSVRGDVRWVPGPNPWSWLLLAGLLAGIVVLASRTRWWGWVLGGTIATMVVVEAVHVVGLFGATTAPVMSMLWASIFSLGGLVLGVIALVWIWRSGASAAVPLIMFAALVLAIAGGLSDIEALWRSQLPTTLPFGFARAAVAVVLGLGVGAVVGAGLRVRAPAEHQPSVDVDRDGVVVPIGGSNGR